MLLRGRYRLVKRIGKGGFCKTFLAVDEGLFPQTPCVVQELSAEGETSKSFEQKAQRLEELGKHPQIPALLSYFQQEQHFYLVQEFIAGRNLAQAVEEEGAFNETQVWHILEDLLPVLQFISDRHIIHRNIKPENIICRTPPYPKGEPNLVIVDFSAAKIVTEIDWLTVENSIGSPEYAAPEQTKGKAVFASDLYSLGVTCIYLLTQISPFDLFDISNNCWVWRDYLTTKAGDIWQQDTKHLRLTKILDKLLQNVASQRFQSADEVMQAMGMESKPQHLKLPNLLWHCSSTLTEYSPVLSSVNGLAFCPEGKILASANDDKNIKLWDLNTKKVIASLSEHRQAVKSVAFSPDGKILASASDDKTIKLWDINTFKEISTLLGHSHAVKSVTFSPDGQILASGSWDKTVKLWNVNTGDQICTLTGHKLQVNSVAFSPQGQIIASASYDRTIRLWQISSQKEFKNCPCYTLSGILSGHAWAVLTVAFSPDGKVLATGSDDKTIKLWEVNTGQLISTLSGHSWSVVSVAFTADGKTLISASWDKTVKLWKVSTAEEIVTLCGHTDSVSAIAVSQVARLIASGSKDKTIKLWQLVE
ncbi:serine/threonine protein kinase [Desmonostoc muscorum LEGE 12446]|uniref:Serine/threonine protein kinase n=1 Tax=Desmonostoc muscorum LEGE 12446 TaxID=1828758 RepID=A0A8J7A1F3_DESMC|nr:serine/threonine-protein kinase [Desmonostoc muscorum]MCF2147701.1 serine/threonine protein kinase [Desmonostoc muscorum LEGE 12446]